MTPHEIDLPLPGLALSVRDQDGYTITAISGDLDIARVPAVREQLLGILVADDRPRGPGAPAVVREPERLPGHDREP